MEGVVYQYNAPMQEDVDPEQAKIARNLLMVESESSSQVGCGQHLFDVTTQVNEGKIHKKSL